MAEASPAHWAVSFEEYLRFEREAEERHELIDGEIVAMAGASRRHNLLCERMRDSIRPALGDGPCTLFGSDQRLAVDAPGKGWVGYYPDLAVYCSNATHPIDSDTMVAPSLLIEVTSKTTERKDRGIKLDDYRAVPALEEYVIVSHVRRELEIWTRTAGVRAGQPSGGWARRLVAEGRATLKLGAVIDVDALYADLPA